MATNYTPATLLVELTPTESMSMDIALMCGLYPDAGFPMQAVKRTAQQSSGKVERPPILTHHHFIFHTSLASPQPVGSVVFS